MAKSPVTVIGLGPMGAAMAATFLGNGHPTTVWNRTAAKAEPLVAKGATLAATPADALAASELIVISQTDYTAMYDSLDSADDAVGALKGRVLVNLSSGSPDELRRAGEWASKHGAEFLTGGVMAPPQGIGKPGAYVFYSGEEEILDRHRETLGELGDTTFVGSDLGLSSLYYQAQLYLFWSTLTAYMHSVALLGTAGVSAEQFRPFAAATVGDLASDGPMGFLKIITETIDAGVHPGDDHTLRMQAVGADHIVEAAREAGIDTAGPLALRDLFWRAVDAGHGSDGLSSVIEVIRRP
ncbi:NAD(P)-dependent oxidoreductase [Actinomadura sp. KC216]|uniref:NAD(P)-dependent oxidoreductase n=1 Tax=Actinomadura sp. KC216 TaxID=2530370 RepID=UPI0010507588|nr:NAD(P)-binding domain-containing protein [Actinomadura sp. KC216]TDB76239.1 NAD(P)-dependent oxidoreductase [Actinomadura sp. KC216]